MTPRADMPPAPNEDRIRLRRSFGKIPVPSVLTAIWVVLSHLFRRRDTVLFPEERPYLPPRYRGRIVLTRDPTGAERCVACYLCAIACPVDCIALQSTEDPYGRRYPEWFRINFSRCIFCGYCEEACPTKAIQLTPDIDMNEYRRPNMVYEKEQLLIDGPGKYHDYDFYQWSGVAVGGKDKGEAKNEAPPTDLRKLTP